MFGIEIFSFPILFIVAMSRSRKDDVTKCVCLCVCEESNCLDWSIQSKRLIFTRTGTPLEVCRWFPQIVFTRLTCGRPINVGFSNCFFVHQMKGFQCLISKKLKKINLRVCFYRLKLRFLGGLKMIIFQVLNHTLLQKVEYLLSESLDLYKI